MGLGRPRAPPTQSVLLKTLTVSLRVIKRLESLSSVEYRGALEKAHCAHIMKNDLGGEEPGSTEAVWRKFRVLWEPWSRLLAVVMKRWKDVIDI